MIQIPDPHRGEEYSAPADFPAYLGTRLRHPRQSLKVLEPKLADIAGPVFGAERISDGENNLTLANGGEAVGQRIIVHGRVLDGNGHAVPHSLIEVWQANASGRYRHVGDNWPGSLDPHFNGGGRCLTDANGHYSFTTIRPGAYPWKNHNNAWRPAHIHFSLFGTAFTQRLVTQMYFPDDPLFFQDPIYNAVPEISRHRMVSAFDYAATIDNWALGFRFDIVLRGANSSVFEDANTHDD